MATTHASHKISTSPSCSKTYLTTPNPFEIKFGYHRAVRKGPFITVSGTTAVKFEYELGSLGNQDDNVDDISAASSNVHHPDNARDQAKVAMTRCIDAVVQLGGRLEDVVRVRMFVARNEDCSDVGAAFRDCFSAYATNEGKVFDESTSEIGAAATMIVVHQGFVDPDMLVEVEVDAIVL